MHNQYETSVVKIKGEAFEEDILFDNLPDEVEDELVFGECIVNEEKNISFNMKNNSNQPIKFTWPNEKSGTLQNPEFTIEP
jgi:hydrocephalus-inducing protein